MAYVGGLRARLIRESVYQEINDALTALGWFTAGRKHSPVQFLATGVPDEEHVVVNTAALADWDVFEREEELGSNFSEHRVTYYVDFYAENDPIGVHFSHDVKDILGGRMGSIGRSAAHIPVYDWVAATPTVIFYVQIENIIIDRPTVFEKPWQRYFRSVRFDVVDNYADEDYGE